LRRDRGVSSRGCAHDDGRTHHERSGNLTELEKAINAQAKLGYRLHTITTAASGSKGLGGGDRIQATMVFEKLS